MTDVEFSMCIQAAEIKIYQGQPIVGQIEKEDMARVMEKSDSLYISSHAIKTRTSAEDVGRDSDVVHRGSDYDPAARHSSLSMNS